MNFKMVGKFLGYLIWTEAGFLLLPLLVSLAYVERESAVAFAITIAICLFIGFLFFLFFHKLNEPIYSREGFVVAGLGWVLISLLGALPFWISREIPHFVDAFFETVSGFTTTGASILPHVEELSHGMLFWRSFTHWLGGIGVLVFLLALLRPHSGTGSSLHLFRAESPGPQAGKIRPKMHDTVRSLYVIYIGLSLINLLFLLVGGMPLFDAFCTMFGTAGTGGFAIKADSMASYSIYLQTVTTVFMLLFGVNFTMYYYILQREWRTALKDEETHLYLLIVFGATVLIALVLWLYDMGSFGYSLHHSAFTVSSIITTTGYATADFDLWPQFARTIILILMIIGAMAGSTGGGFKVARLLILLKSAKAGIHRLMHPRSVKAVQINKKTVDEEVIKNTQLFLFVYCFILLISFALISLDNLSLETNFSAILTCFNNVGPGLALVGPTSNFSVYSTFSKIILALNMLLGRLEIFPILLLLNPSIWRIKR